MRARAQATVEFALVVPLLIILLVAVVDGARLYIAQTALTNVVRESARYAAGRLGESTVIADAQQAGLNMAVGLNRTDVASRLVITVNGAAVGARVEDYPHTIITPFVGWAVGNPVRLSASTTEIGG